MGIQPPIFGPCLLWPNSCIDQHQLPLPKKGTEPQIFSPFLFWPNGWMHQDATWYGGRPHTRGLWVRWGPSLPLPKGRRRSGEESPQFSSHGYCGRTAGWIKMALGMEVGLGPVHIVLDGDTAPLPKTGAEPAKFSAHLYCGQTAGCIKMLLGTEVGLSPGDFVLDGDPALPSPERQRSPGGAPNFRPCLFRPNNCMYQDTTWCGGRPQPRRHCVRWGPSSPTLMGHSPSNFRPMSVVAIRLDGSRCHLERR